MENVYYCSRCQYKTKDPSNWNRHKKTKKHKAKSTKNTEIPPINRPIHTDNSDFSRKKKSYMCAFCFMGYSRKDSMKRHEAQCSMKIIKEKDDMLDKKDFLLGVKEKELMKYEEELHYFKQLVQLSSKSDNKDISTFKYINDTYSDADPLKAITYEEFTENNDIQFVEGDNDYDEQLIEDILYSYRHKTLPSYIGKVIIRIYKKDDPSEQSLWNTDESRLKYMVRKNIRKNIDRWTTDKKGVYTIEKIIKPITDKIKNLMNDYYEKYCLPTETSGFSWEEQSKIMRDREDITKLHVMIDDERINKDVLKYISPFFHAEKLRLQNIKRSKKISK
jgi:hypothetical protein